MRASQLETKERTFLVQVLAVRSGIQRLVQEEAPGDAALLVQVGACQQMLLLRRLQA